MRFRGRAYARMLDSLSAEHRQLLCALIGQLTITETPDLKAATRKLDDELTSGEKSAINDAGSALEASARQAHEDRVKRLLESGAKLTFGSGEFPRLAHADPSMALLKLSIEELITNLNGFYRGRPGSSHAT